MSDTETSSATEAHPQGPVGVQKPNGKAQKQKIFPKKLGKDLKAGKDDRKPAGWVNNISVKNAGDRSCEFQFELTGKKGVGLRYALDPSDMGRLSMLAGLIGVAQSTNAKVRVISTSNANGQDYVTGLEIKTKR
jgi:hypothetical protein